MTRGQLVARVSQVLGLATSGADSTEELQMIQDTINEAVVDILSRTRINVRCVNITLTAGVREYDLSQTILRMYDVWQGTTRLQELSPGDSSRDMSSVSAGTFAIVGFNRIRLDWSPDSSSSTLSAWYTPRPTPMTDNAHDPSAATYGAIPAEFHQAIINYCCWLLADMAGDQGSGRGDKYRAWYEGKDGLAGPGTNIGRINAAVNMRGGSGSRRGRMMRAGEVNSGDIYPDQWTG